MSAYSDWKCGALTDEEYEYYASWEVRGDDEEDYEEDCEEEQ